MNNDFTQLRRLLTPLYGEGEARAIAFLVFEEGFGVSRTDIYADKVKQFSADDCAAFRNICNRLAAGDPVQYVLGCATFCGHRFLVCPSVLIPRPETEELVRRAAALCPPGARVLDAGTGSGCIAVSLALLRPDLRIEAWDISPAALRVATRNAALLLGEGQTVVRFRRADLTLPWPDVAPFDAILSNPPYVCEQERAGMAPHVLRHEPAAALFVPDADPLRFYRALAAASAAGALRRSPAAAVPRSLLLVEINRAYGAEVLSLFSAHGLHAPVLFPDLFGNDRFVLARL